jgi:hypothetical protein
MPELVPAHLIQVIRDEFARLDHAGLAFRPRRPGAQESRYRRFALELTRSFAYLDTHDQDDLGAYSDRALALGSWLFVIGAEPRAWKRWLALASFAAFLLTRFARARALAVLADEWDFVDHLGGRLQPDLSVEDHVVASLTGAGAPDWSAPALDDYSRACLSLAESIPAREHGVTESALLAMCDFWLDMAGYMHDPNPEHVPEFEPAVCALATLAVRDGYRPQSLPTEVVSFLAPGLAAEPEQHWFAQYFRTGR